MDAKNTANEQGRIAALKRYRILDTEAEIAFDDLTNLAAALCGTPMATVAFIDETRQWFKSKVGCVHCEDPREISFCAHTIQHPYEINKVTDATLDERFKNNPLVVGQPGIRYYLGAPLTTSDGFAIGTICAVDFVARPIEEKHVNALRALARQTIAQLELRLHVLELQEHAEKQKLVEEALREASDSKSFFLANMSHEIRTPLTSIVGFSEMLQEPGALSSTDASSALHAIHRNSAHLLLLLNDILDLSKIGAKQLVLEELEFATSALTQDIKCFVGNRAAERGLSFNISVTKDVPDLLNSDPTRLKQILFKVIGNALKFTEAGSVSLSISRSSDMGLQFSVRDTGIGMSEKAVNGLFQPFMQAEQSTTRKYGGTGLGLAISKKLVELLSGTIEVRSKLNAGTEFIITFPKSFCVGVSQSVLPVAGPVVGQSSSATTVKILIAEDVPDNRDLLRLLFKKMGIIPAFAENGEDAVSMATLADFDLILMDIQMPVMDGLEATRRLLQEGYKKPIVALTANSSEEVSKSYLSKGFAGVLGKPFAKQEFIDLLNRHVSLK